MLPAPRAGGPGQALGDDWPGARYHGGICSSPRSAPAHFADGTVGEVEVLDRMRGPVFAGARTPAGFARVRVDPETGTVVWPGGADLAPDMLYEHVRSGK